jgi:hypothetical protein
MVLEATGCPVGTWNTEIEVSLDTLTGLGGFYLCLAGYAAGLSRLASILTIVSAIWDMLVSICVTLFFVSDSELEDLS